MCLFMLHRNIHFFWFLLVLVLALLSIEPQAQTTSPINTKHQFDEQKLESLRKEVDYQYEEVSAELSTWQKIKQAIREWLGSLIDTQQKQTVWSWVLTIFAGLVLLIVFMRFMGVDKYFVLDKKIKESERSNLFEQFEELDEGNLEQKIQEAIKTQNYTLAVRWFYLKSLKMLQNKQWIQWQKDKTNQIYLLELTHNKPMLSEPFQLLTRWFEYIYYGDFEIEATEFETLKANFEDFQHKILVLK